LKSRALARRSRSSRRVMHLGAIGILQ
jgi:hypothetical protein